MLRLIEDAYFLRTLRNQTVLTLRRFPRTLSRLMASICLRLTKGLVAIEAANTDRAPLMPKMPPALSMGFRGGPNCLNCDLRDYLKVFRTIHDDSG